MTLNHGNCLVEHFVALKAALFKTLVELDTSNQPMLGGELFL